MEHYIAPWYDRWGEGVVRPRELLGEVATCGAILGFRGVVVAGGGGGALPAFTLQLLRLSSGEVIGNVCDI